MANTFQNLLPLRRSVAMPAGGATTFSGAIDGASEAAPLAASLMLCVDAPALATGQLPDGETLTYALVQANRPDLSSAVVTVPIGVQTGAGGAGAAAATFAAKLSPAGGRYVGLSIAASAGAAAGAQMLTVYPAVFG